ncbi:MAG: hypothetical protein KGD64_10990 [Candidatus Heimdallarchaeota archaeon]|nr:hypothetical protein [Candidatus Heimdallarchaeota archaeon]
MSFKSNVRQKVEYQCNNCSKVRILFISPALQSEQVAATGYQEYIDVHYCKEEYLNAIKLFVDSHYNVRSQVTVKTSKNEKEAEIKELQGFSIPIPKASSFLQYSIKSTNDFGSYNLKSLVIKDKFRQTDYHIKGEEEGEKIESFSSLEFIQIEANVSSELETEQVKRWLLSLANSLETLVVLDEELLKYLGTHLDHIIADIPSHQVMLELDILLNSTIAIPHSSQAHLDIFETHRIYIFPELSAMGYRIYKLLLNTCLTNEHKTLMQIYNEIKKEMVQVQAFPFFLSVISTLVTFGFINLEKLEFLTV